MCSNWKSLPLKETCEFKSGKRVAGTTGRFPIYGGNGILGYTNESNLNCGVIVGRVGAYCGSVYYVNSPIWVSDNAISITNASNDQQVDIKFIYYFLRSKNINSMQIGTSQPLITQKILGGIDVKLPGLQEQKLITSILSVLDDKIENNNKINNVLEEIAQTLFKRWFVDFDFPNEDGNPYKSNGGKMVDSEIGMIPKNWKVMSLLDIAEYTNGLAMQKFRPDIGHESMKVLKIKELRRGYCGVESDECTTNIPGQNIVNDGDVIFSWSGTLMLDIWTGGKCGLNQHLYKVTSNTYPKWLYYFWTEFYLADFIKIAQDRATTMGHIKRSNLENSKVVVPESITNFNLMELIFQKLIKNKLEIVRLKELRDALLPKLMSGEIRVPIDND